MGSIDRRRGGGRRRGVLIWLDVYTKGLNIMKGKDYEAKSLCPSYGRSLMGFIP
jgi:hypothetical protein